MQVIKALLSCEQELCSKYKSELMSSPSLTPTMIQGGRTRNMVPDECIVAVDLRILPGMEAKQTVDEIMACLDALPVKLQHHPFQCFAPALNTQPDDCFVQRVVEFCGVELGFSVRPSGVPYGSDAGWLPDSIPTIVLGPGNIAQAHAVDEYVEVEQLNLAAEIYRKILLHDWCQ